MNSTIFILIFISFSGYGSTAKDLAVYNSKIICEHQANMLNEKFESTKTNRDIFFCLEVEGKP